MNDQEIEETQEIDELDTDSGETETDDTIQEEDDNNTSAKKNNSNFKALYRSNKENKALLAQQAELLAEKEEELNQWREFNPEIVEELDSKKDISSIKEEMFTIKNPDAEPHLKDIRKTMLEYNMDINKAWKFVKMDIPEESKSKTDFNI